MLTEPRDPPPRRIPTVSAHSFIGQNEQTVVFEKEDLGTDKETSEKN